MSIKLRALAGASLLAATAALAGAAHAGTIYGAGSSLIAPYQRQIADCYGTVQPLYGRTGATTSPVSVAVSPFNYASPSGGSQNCATTHTTTNTVQYLSTGSGIGIAGLYSHDASRYGDVDPATAGAQNYPSVQYGLSETVLLAADVANYNSGGVIQGVTLRTLSAPGDIYRPNEYPIPRALYGPLVQFPVAVAPIAIAYDPVYKKVRQADGTITSYRFNVVGGRSNGGLKLDATTYCKILNGQMTDWNDPALTTLNGGTSLKDPTDPAAFSVPLQIVGDRDSSGTTQITTRHLAAACGGVSGNLYTNINGASTLPAALVGPTYDKSLTNNTAPAGEAPYRFTVAAGSDGVAKYIDFTAVPGLTAGDTLVQGRIGYVGNGYTLPYAANAGLTFTLYNASLQNLAGNFKEPTLTSANTTFGSNLPPQSKSTGVYDASVTANGSRANPEDWVRVGNLANPPSTVDGYPIVGTTNWIGYSCYAAGNIDVVRTASGGTQGFLNFVVDETVVDDTAGNSGILPSAGLAGLPAAWQRAIKQTFILPVAATAGLNLVIAPAGTSSPNSNCTSATGA
uniref:PBP domain-containing protein n=1 Tax=Caulobacter sp. (strain K31) TaxID=366602 RepID=B0T7Q4_CAUSK